MSRKTTTIKVEDIEDNEYRVDLKEELSWGEAREIQSAMTSKADMQMRGDDVDVSLDGSAYGDYSLKTLEVAIAKIEGEEGEVDFSQEWADKLTRESGDKLFETANEKLGSGEKKS